MAASADRTVPDPKDEPTVSVDRAAVILGISRNGAYEAARAGELPTIKIGRRLLVPTTDLRRMLNMNPEP